MRKSKYIYSLQGVSVILILLFMTSCSENEPIVPVSEVSKDLRVKVTLNNYENSPASRAFVEISDSESGQDKWSYKDFTDGDELAFYAGTTDGKYFENLAMIFTITEITDNNGTVKKYSFAPKEDQNFNATTINGNSVFMYFPYTDQMPTNLMPSLPGLELRVKQEPFTNIGDVNGPWRCVDFLVSNGIDVSDLDNGIISGTLEHSFSELIITRGEGFDSPKAPQGIDPYLITVKLNKPYTHVQVNCTHSPWKCSINLVNQSGYKPEGETGDFDATIWHAWQGGNYAETVEDTDGKPAWYVLLPTMGDDTSNIRSRVEYIQLYDNEGNLQTIRDLYLSGEKGYVHHQPGNYLDRKWRYPMHIAMQELVPTVFPYTIKEWENGEITNARTRGIRADNFNNWLSSYNYFIADNRTNDANLSQYGDKIGNHWHFYILESLNLSDYSTSPIIPRLEDVIDGSSAPAASPVIISGLSQPFVNIMAGTNDSILNISFDHPNIILTGQTTPAGSLVNSMSGGGISNITIDQGYLSTQNAVGMFVGNMTAGSITNSKASGVVLGSVSESGSGFLVGTLGSSISFTANNSTVVFSNINANGN